MHLTGGAGIVNEKQLDILWLFKMNDMVMRWIIHLHWVPSLFIVKRRDISLFPWR